MAANIGAGPASSKVTVRDSEKRQARDSARRNPKSPPKKKAKGKGKNKIKPPQALAGKASETSSGERICWAFNLFAPKGSMCVRSLGVASRTRFPSTDNRPMTCHLMSSLRDLMREFGNQNLSR